jgi:hypothetical protein
MKIGPQRDAGDTLGLADGVARSGWSIQLHAQRAQGGLITVWATCVLRGIGDV